MSKWRRAKDDEYQPTRWEDCTIGMVCKCGYEFILDGQDGTGPWSTCVNCGKKWRLFCQIQIADATAEEIEAAREYQSITPEEHMRRLREAVKEVQRLREVTG